MTRISRCCYVLALPALLPFPSTVKSVCAQGATATVLGSCNIIQQNVTVPSGSTVINQVDCTPQRPEDSFSLRYVWLDETTTSLMVAGHFDSSLKPIIGSAQTILKNKIYHDLQGITERYGNSLIRHSQKEQFKTVGDDQPQYSIMGSKGNVPVNSDTNRLSLDKIRDLKIYDGSQHIVLPDMQALNTIFKTQNWPDDYKMSYSLESADPANLRGTEAENAAFQCTLLYRYVGKEDLEKYWDKMDELKRFVQETPLSGDVTKRAKTGADDVTSPALKNKAVDAMLYFGESNWPRDFVLAFSDFNGGGTGGCEGPYSIELTAFPRKLLTLVVVVEAMKDSLDIQGMTFAVDSNEGLHTLGRGERNEQTLPGAVILKKGETLIIPLRIELRYDLEDTPFRSVVGSTTARSRLYDRISQLPGDPLRFQGYEWPDDNEKHVRARTLFAKKKSSFRKPESASITQTYVFGPSYELKSFTLRGQSISVRSAPASALAYLGPTGIGSCPFFFIDDQADGYIKVGRILVGANDQQSAKTEEIVLPNGTPAVYVSEQEPELTHLERVSVRAGPERREKVLAEGVLIRPGRASQIIIPEDFRHDATIIIRGYYDPLHVMAGISRPATSTNR